MDVGRYLFKRSKQSYSNTISDFAAQFSLNTYPSLKFHNFSNFERWRERVKWLEVQFGTLVDHFGAVV
jgi:hypothetical protein